MTGSIALAGLIILALYASAVLIIVVSLTNILDSTPWKRRRK